MTPDHERLAERVRELLTTEPELTEQRMFGGLAFLLGGHMTVAVSGRGGLMVRADPAELDRHLRAGAEPMEMRGRPMAGWLLVGTTHLRTKRQLATWVKVGTNYVATLPAKVARAKRR